MIQVGNLILGSVVELGQICTIIILCFEKRWSNLKLDIFFQDPDQNVAECVDKKRFFMDKK